MSRKRDPKKPLERETAAGGSTSNKAVVYDGIRDVIQDEFEWRGGPSLLPGIVPRGLLSRRRRMVLAVFDEYLPDDVVVRIRITASMAATLANLQPDLYGKGSPGYTTTRGANIAQAKTVRASDGTWDVVIDWERFLNESPESQAEVDDQTQILEHLAAHEPQHILMHLSGTDSSDYVDSLTGSPTVRAWRHYVGEAIDEFRCELAANRRVTMTPTHESTTSDDITHFRIALNESAAHIDDNPWRAAMQALGAAKEMVKALSYLAAEYAAGGREPLPPSPLPAGWDEYIGQFWPEMFELFASVPAANEPASVEFLTTVLQATCERVTTWLRGIGIRYEKDEDLNDYCWWDRREF
nr:hypothetical protein [Rhodococcus sp. 15-1189-1-1a]